MAISTFMGVQTALRGILAQQRALEVTSHNIANANTVGYTRQEAVLTAAPAMGYPAVSRGPQAGQIGTGVDVTEYRRIRDTFVDVQLRAQTMRQGSAEARQDALRQVELATAEPSDNGLASLLGRYWSSWHDVVNAPENIATRQALAQSATSLAEGLNTFASQLSTIGAQTDQNVALTLAEVNSVATSIAALNESVSHARVAGDQPNDLFDQRDALLDRLAKLGNVSVTQGSLGQIDVSFGGVALVTGSTAVALDTDPAAIATTLPGLSSGKLAGLVEIRDVRLPAYRDGLDTIASTLIAQTNALHTAGFDLEGNAGGAFFTGTDAGDIAVNAAIVAAPKLIAASADGQPGNSANALALAGLRATPLIAGATIDTAYSQLITAIGADSKEAQRTFHNATVLADALVNRRESISGVSLDEEMTNLLRFQRGYQASARALTALDEAIELIVTRTGRVGL